MTTNGVLHDSPAQQQLEQSLGGLAFDLGKWRRFTELALAEGEKRRERVRQEVEQAFAEAEAAIQRLDRELDVLRRALALEPIEPPPGLSQGECSPAENLPQPAPPPSPVATWVQALVDREDGANPEATLPELEPLGQGTRVGEGKGYRASLFLLEVLRLRPGGEMTRDTAKLACRGWSPRTMDDGLRRLLAEGLLERPARGLFRLTRAGWDAPPAPPGMLPLREPKEEEPEGALARR